MLLPTAQLSPTSDTSTHCARAANTAAIQSTIAASTATTNATSRAQWSPLHKDAVDALVYLISTLVGDGIEAPGPPGPKL